jgi:hypothetical protein
MKISISSLVIAKVFILSASIDLCQNFKFYGFFYTNWTQWSSFKILNKNKM